MSINKKKTKKRVRQEWRGRQNRVQINNHISFCGCQFVIRCHLQYNIQAIDFTCVIFILTKPKFCFVNPSIQFFSSINYYIYCSKVFSYATFTGIMMMMMSMMVLFMLKFKFWIYGCVIHSERKKKKHKK